MANKPKRYGKLVIYIDIYCAYEEVGEFYHKFARLFMFVYIRICIFVHICC